MNDFQAAAAMNNLTFSMLIIIAAVLIGFLLGRLWEIVFGGPGMTLDEAINLERDIRGRL